MATSPHGTYRKGDLEGRLRTFESRHDMTSEEFFTKWERGELPHTDEYFEWAGLCGYLGVRELDLA